MVVQLDLSYAALFTGWALAEEQQRRLAAEGFADVRFNDGFVFQHLIEGPIGAAALAERMGVTQQAASKAVADLERRGYVQRAETGDGRARPAELSARGRAVVEAGRRHRAEIERGLAERHGPERVEAARALLLDVLDTTGAATAVRGRRVRGPA
jgi:DNA-binding MarR family transcriptional regulator